MADAPSRPTLAVEFWGSCARPAQYPEGGLPEVLLLGRSNAGKSSLVNALTGRRALARISKHPGRTRCLNFYRVQDRLFLTDAPGYGYAAVAQTERAGWIRQIETYLERRSPLVGVVQIVDARHDPSVEDIAWHRRARSTGRRVLVVAHKADAVSRGQRAARLGAIQEGLCACDPPLAVSSRTGEGIGELWERIQAWTRAAGTGGPAAGG